MENSEQIKKIEAILNNSQSVVIVQPDNPDTDSLASALALELILGNLSKQPILYCAIDLPSYLKSISGADRVTADLPKNFDCSIIVDTASDSLLAQTEKTGHKSWLAARPSVVLDHHGTEPTINFASVIYSPKAAATGEVIYELCHKLGWPMDQTVGELLAVAILSDTLGLTSSSTSARTVHIIGELVEMGVSLAKLEQFRRESLRRDPELVHYKGQLLQRVQYHLDNRVATLVIPWPEIERYSPYYNPSMLVIDDMRIATGTILAACFKVYQSGKITAKIRSNYGYPLAAKLAEHFGGGGHDYASGFKVESAKNIEDLIGDFLSQAEKLLEEMP